MSRLVAGSRVIHLGENQGRFDRDSARCYRTPISVSC